MVRIMYLHKGNNINEVVKRYVVIFLEICSWKRYSIIILRRKMKNC